MAFKMKGMNFGEGTGSAMKKGKEGGDMAKFSAVMNAANVDWGDAGEAADLQSKMSETEAAKNINKADNPDPSAGHTPQTVQPVEEITPQTVEPVKEITPQTVTDKETDTTTDNNQNSKNEKEEIESPLKNYKKGYYGIK